LKYKWPYNLYLPIINKLLQNFYQSPVEVFCPDIKNYASIFIFQMFVL